MPRDVCIKTYLNKHAAEIVRMHLESRGIRARIQCDDAGGTEPGLTFGRGVRLMVLPQDSERALGILKAAGSGD
ncbi:MAG: hypothetical protein PHN49_00740 [Candidatus Omnitrophica bacterium]|nr:hypothetical protein [Candidatus Omnitrophota bacterium]MDD5670149.1 hypothetical protein [Candidatus Omnitrophota bacterium]